MPIARRPDRSRRPDLPREQQESGDVLPAVTTPGADPPPPEDLAPEALLVVLRGIGASLFLTDRHLILARDGAERRPRTGVQAFDLDAIRHIRIELGSGPSGRIAVWTTGGQEVLSMFFDARSLERAHELLDVARPLIARSRRGRSGSEREPVDRAPARSRPAPTDRRRR